MEAIGGGLLPADSLGVTDGDLLILEDKCFECSWWKLSLCPAELRVGLLGGITEPKQGLLGVPHPFVDPFLLELDVLLSREAREEVVEVTDLHMYVCMRVCMRVCMCVCIYI